MHGDGGTGEDVTSGTSSGIGGSSGTNVDGSFKGGDGAANSSGSSASSSGIGGSSGTGSGGKTDGGSSGKADGGSSGGQDAGTLCTSPNNPPGCVQCRTGADCAAGMPHCANGMCVQCATSADCAGTSTPACYPSTHTCRASCVNDAGACSGFTPVCDSTSGACVGCRSSSDCSANARVCDPTTQQCVQCDSDSDCAGTSTPHCYTPTNTCAACGSNADCTNPSTPICKASMSMFGPPGPPSCQPGCTSNSQCADAGAPVCDSMGNCVRCAANSDCPSATPVCDTVFNSGCFVCLPPPPGSDAGSQGCDGGTCMAVGGGGPNFMFRCQ